MLERLNGFKGDSNTPSPIQFDSEGFHRFEVPMSCQFIVSARVNKTIYDNNPNSLFVEFKDGYLAYFKSDEVAEKMLGELENELKKVRGVKVARIEDREVFYIEFEHGVDIPTLLANIDKKIVEISQWDNLPE